MSTQRTINWSTAMRDLRKDRVAPAAPGFLAARSVEIARLDRLAKEAAAAPLAVAGSYDRSAIMKAAIASARAQKAKGSKAPWSQLVGFALKNIWRHAKAQRALALN
ncbi:hypothetical protein HPT29_026740 (plasmid) [Microvirga terrae]|uniref:Uncharacterized protein n=1 Tax=Microvirga terrae TaxID=2740529 RepID=A0ABY5RYD6_9HYPH|nr:hypothetical protein [Microvirga terrae]UVF22280.1 hypothetical protein HPT29_026740 [Microvirga terrae]